MKTIRSRLTRAISTAALLIVGAGSAAQVLAAQGVTTTQTLDRVFTYTTGAALYMDFSEDRDLDYYDQGLAPATLNFSTCTLTPLGGLYCLDGQTVRKWPTPSSGGPSDDPPILNCSVFNGTCSSMTVALDGAIWVAVKKRNSHDVYKITPNAQLPTSPAYTGRPPIVDLVAVDGEAAKEFRPPGSAVSMAGALGIEERKNAVFFPDPALFPGASTITVVSSRDWGLSGNELLQDAALLQVPNGTGGKRNFILATTTKGRVLAKNTEMPGTATVVYNIPAARDSAKSRTNSSPLEPVPAIQCSSTQQYGLRAGQTTGIVYISDRSYCQVLALTATLNSAGDTIVSLDRVLQPPPAGSVKGKDLVLLTAGYPVLGLTVSPGKGIDLREACSVNCVVVNPTRAGYNTGAEFSAVKLAAGPSGATVFQVKGIPDCRYKDAFGFPTAKLTFCNANFAEVVTKPAGLVTATDKPAAWYLNVTPMLPPEITSSFDLDPNTPPNDLPPLPPLLISPQYRGQSQNFYVFEALFVVTQAGVQFVDTFTNRFDLAGMDLSSLGCVPDSTPRSDLLKWDIGTVVSEKHKSVGGKSVVDGTTVVGNYVDRLTNLDKTNCGSYRGGAAGYSLLPYNLEVSPDTLAWTVSGSILNGPVRYTENNDAVFARLMQKLYGDLNTVLDTQACAKFDSPGALEAPIASNVCPGLKETLNNGAVKLDKCISAAFQPKSSLSNENCQSFVSQLSKFRTSLPSADPTRTDIANRLGELKTRAEVVQALYDDRFLPSIPSLGFCRERKVHDPSYTGSCALPW
jgi:hypothetical protein